MLTKEYGHLSPWVGVGAYTAATATGFMRLANDRHWFSDVLAGAGFGILVIELGYLFTDLIFKEKGLICSRQGICGTDGKKCLLPVRHSSALISA